ncbi:glycoside hydrolase family 76 protein [Hypholoma sublateritium FD-334 SS-4]|uniref:Glycoside hydrolase family 76 protein n=1 Tax=Hypholoma sublateritium (strain FD-334 SS-4) TaxID=945553 RepID=A0A0D2PIV3_HYPSF|nr:glycoside hydrolase family 76 protein [Hypholoma sublateritium FD-334 SS-4]
MPSCKSLFVSIACAVTLVSAQQCQATLNIALGVAERLQSEYFNTGNGQYNGGSLWTDANTLEDLHNLMLATGTDQFASVADESFIGQSANNPNTNWASLLGGSNDDAGWVVLSLWKMADYKANRGLSNTAFLNAASEIYNIIAGQWDDTCGGGVWWSTAHTYKNAITNELFLLLSASGFLRNGNPTYLANAQKAWAWISASGMRNSQGLFNDGLDSSTCQNNGETTWTYNQGVIASGLAALFVATGDSTLLDQAEITLDATVALLTAGTSILKESCDDALAGGSVCDADQQIFKGVWTKHLQYYLDMAGSSRVAKYSGFLGSQESAVFHFGTDASDDVGSVWYAPNQGGSIFTPKTSASGLAAHVSAAKYGPC